MIYAYTIPVFPLLAFLLILFFGKRLQGRSALVAIAGSLLATVVSTFAILQVLQGERFRHALPWIEIADIQIPFGLLIDPLTAMMLFVVTYVGTLIIIYSVGYMHQDPRFSRFFAYLSLFMFSMLGLVLSNNFIMLYLFWELVGLCSYLLISFWFEKPAAAHAGRKAFITTRIGDVGLLLGILLLFYTTGTITFHDLTREFLAGKASGGILTLACILIFLGACGKSAQFPLHVWLPDAMEGPTPVSALIHAATMVVAGVYLVARSFVIFSVFPQSLDVVAYIGTTTAFMAAFIALTATDIKKVLAYSTISQLGYMMAALGVGGFSAGTFHLMTHAFFKALLFLGAGSVIHGTETQDLREMGGLLTKMKVTGATMLIACLAIAGIPPFSGFFSKDEILIEAFHANSFIFWTLLVTAFMTSFYMFRLFFLTFLGKPRKALHAHESPAVMTMPLAILAVFSAGIGIIGSPWMHHWFQTFIHEGHAEVLENPWVMKLSIGVAAAGILIAFLFYVLLPKLAEWMGKILKPFYLVSFNKFWMDELYQNTVIRAGWALSRVLAKFDLTVIDGAVNQAAFQTMNLSKLKNLFDQYVVDGAVNGVGWITQRTSAFVRLVQTGFIQNYLLILFVGVVLMLFLQIK